MEKKKIGMFITFIILAIICLSIAHTSRIKENSEFAVEEVKASGYTTSTVFEEFVKSDGTKYNFTPNVQTVTELETTDILYGSYQFNYTGASSIVSIILRDSNITVTDQWFSKLSTLSGYEWLAQFEDDSLYTSIKDSSGNQLVRGNSSAGELKQYNSGDKIYKAYLVLAERAVDADTRLLNDYPITLVGPNGKYLETKMQNIRETGTERYAAYMDVTEFVQDQGYGWYYCCNVPYYYSGSFKTDQYSAWKLIVIEENADIPLRALTLKLGYQTTTSSGESVNVSINSKDIKTKSNGEVTGQILYSLEGADIAPGDNVLTLTVDGTTQTDFYKESGSTSVLRTDMVPVIERFTRNGNTMINNLMNFDSEADSITKYTARTYTYNDKTYTLKGNMQGSDVDLLEIDGSKTNTNLTVGNSKSAIEFNLATYDCVLQANALGLAVDIEGTEYENNISTEVNLDVNEKEIMVTGQSKNIYGNNDTGLYNTKTTILLDDAITVDPDMVSVVAKYTKNGEKTPLEIALQDISIDGNQIVISWGDDLTDVADLTLLGDTLDFEITGLTVGTPKTQYNNQVSVTGILYSSGVKTDKSVGELAKDESVIEYTDIVIEKTWLDNNNVQGLRPENIVVELYRDGKEEPIGIYEIPSEETAETQTYTIENLISKDDNGTYTYHIKEKEITLDNGDEYITTIDGTNITNKLTGITSKTITTVWNDKENANSTRPENLNIELHQNGTKIDEYILNVETEVSYTFENLAKYDENGKLYDYTAEETETPVGYEKTINGLEVVNNLVTKNYTVEYYYDGELDNTKTETLTANYKDVIDTYEDKNIIGYKLDKVEGTPLTIDIDETTNIIKVYYIKDEFEYSIEYYYENELDDTKTVKGIATYQDVIDTYEDKNITGYKFDKVDNLPLTVTELSENNIIKVYYVRDEFAYTVEYYYDGILDENKTVTKIAKYGDIIDTYEDENITGYKLEIATSPLLITELAVNNVIKVYYIKDSFNYTVEYYYDGVLDDTKTVTETAVYQDVITSCEDKNITGYEFEKVEGTPLTITEIESNNVIRVYYIKDEFDYTIEYYYDGELDDTKTITGMATYQDIISTYEDKNIIGYTLEKVEGSPLAITEIAANNVIKVYYIKDKFNYTVEYYYDGVIDNTKIEEIEATYQDIIDTYEDKNITGYKFEKVEGSPLTITEIAANNVIKVYYIKDKFNYTVEYYYDGAIDNTKTEEIEATYQDIIDTYEDKNITGYTLDKVEGTPLTITEVEENNIIKVYYIKDKFEYTVEYYYDNVKNDSNTVISKATYQDVINTYEDKNITGYKLDKVEGTPLTITEVEENNIIKVYYIKDEFVYSVEYYYNNEKDDSKTITGIATYQDIINTYDAKEKIGYTLDKVENLPLTISEKETNNIVKVYYAIDETQTKDIAYTVEYYKNGVKVEADTQIEKTTVQVLESDTIVVDKTQINLVDKYYGYKLETTDSETIPSVVSNGDVIKVYYVIDEAQTKDIAYTVEYYKDGNKVEADTQIEKTTVQVLESDTIVVDKTQINLVDKYYGYKLETTDPETIPSVVSNGDVIKIYYTTDENQTKDIAYTVEYYKDGVKVEADTQIEKTTVQVLETDNIAVDKTQINLINKYYGYTVKSTDPEIIPDVATNGDIIKVYYITDESLTKSLNYTVEYYKDGVKVEADTQIEKATVQVLKPNTLTVNKDEINVTDKYYGYKFEKTEPEIIENEIATGTTIKVYYITDEAQTKELSYTVEYYKDGVKVEADTQIEKATVQVLESDTIAVDKTQINLVNKYYGYTVQSTEPEIIPDEVITGTTIKVNYIIDASQTKELSYTVEYYKDGVKVEADTQIEKATVQVLESDNIAVDKTQINVTDKYYGYKFVETNPEVIPDMATNGDIIKVYYETDNAQTKELSYTVEYYKDGIKVEADTQIEKATVQVLEDDTLTVDKTQINITDKYYGYKFVETNPEIIPDMATNGDIIKVYYEIDETQIKELSYTVEYYKDGVKVEADTQIVTKEVQVLESDNMTVDETQINLVNKYLGYKFDKTAPETIPNVVSNGDVIRVYYVLNSEDVKVLNYTVEYYKDGIKVENDTQIETSTVHVLEPNILTIDKTQINLTDKYIGYAFEKTEPSIIGDTIESGSTIKVYYTTDENQTKTLSYMVEYYKDGEKVEADTQIVTKEVQVLESNTLTVDKTQINTVDKYHGYVLEKTEPVEIPTEVNTNEVIKIYYKTRTDISYTVEYYYDNVIDNSKTVVVEGQKFGDLIETYENKIIPGYVLEIDTAPLVLDTENNVLKVYYIKDEFNYTVEYYYNGVKDDTKTIVDKDTFKNVINTYIEKEEFGYMFDKTESLPLEITENSIDNIIKIYYVTDPSQTKEISYTVEYYKEGMLQEADTVKGTKTIQVLEPQELDVDATLINIVDKYYPYEFEKTEPAQIPTKVNNGDVIKVYYVKQKFDYTVEYYYDGIKNENNTQILKGKYEDIISTFTNKNITGYKLDKTENLPLIVSDVTENNVIKVYYVKDKFDYTVEYYYDGIKDSSKTDIIKATYGDTINTYTDKNISGYTLEKVDGLPLVITELPATNLIKVYYSKDKFSYTVNYYYDGIKDDTKTETIFETFGSQVNTYTDKAEYGYKFEKQENLPLTITEKAENNIINIYYIRKDSTIKLQYIDRVTGLDIAEEVIKNGKVLDICDLSIDKKEIDGYVLVESPENVRFEEETQTKVFYYAKVANVVVKYVEKDTGLEINSQDIISGYEGKEYSVNKKVIENYTYVENSGNISGQMSANGTEVIFYYLRNSSVVVNYIDRENGTILETITQNGKFGDVVATTAKNFDNYVLVEEPVNKTVTMTKETLILNYYYAHVSSGVVEKHINAISGEVIENTVYSGNEGDAYVTTAKTFEGYDILADRMPENATGTMRIEPIEVKYYYIKKSSVRIEYIDRQTGIKISEDTIINGHEADQYSTIAKEIASYGIVDSMMPENATGTMASIETVVKYYYAKISEGVIEKHVDIKTGEVIKEVVYSGKEGDSYSTKVENLEGYDIVKENLPTNSTGVMESGKTEVVYYYIKKTSVIIEYIDKNTGEKLIEVDSELGAEKDSTEVIKGHQGDSYTSEEKTFENYKFVEHTNNTEGTMENVETKVTYYYVHFSEGVVEKYIDVMTGKEIENETKQEGFEGDEYTSLPKQLEGYDVVTEKMPTKTQGKMEQKLIEIRYYYIRKVKVTVQYIEKTTGTKMVVDLVIEGHEGDSYVAEQKSFAGYELIEIPNNNKGQMGTEDIIVTYYYNKIPTVDNSINNTQNNTPNNTGNATGSGNNNNVVTQNVHTSLTPNTGDMAPVLSIYIIIITILLNIIQIGVSKVNKKS